MPGHAGNFLARLFSLGANTMPQLPSGLLDSWITQRTVVEVDRNALYSFKTVYTRYDNWQQFHRAWADYYNNRKYRLLNAVWKNKFDTMVSCIHPHEFILFEQDILNFSTELFYVHVDEKYQAWVDSSKQKLRFVYRPNEHEYFDELRERYSMKRIDLTKILDSDASFEQEYLKCCDMMGLVPELDKARMLYHDWKSVRL